MAADVISIRSAMARAPASDHPLADIYESIEAARRRFDAISTLCAFSIAASVYKISIQTALAANSAAGRDAAALACYLAQTGFALSTERVADVGFVKLSRHQVLRGRKAMLKRLDQDENFDAIVEDILTRIEALRDLAGGAL